LINLKCHGSQKIKRILSETEFKRLKGSYKQAGIEKDISYFEPFLINLIAISAL
jgi:hypothetical protein